MKRAALVVLMLATAAQAKPPRVNVPSRTARKPSSKARSMTKPLRAKPAAVVGTDTLVMAIGGQTKALKELLAEKGARSIEEETAAKIAKLLRGPLRNGDTGLYVADAITGAPLFAVNADERMNPASNVKMISTATSLELLGASFRYPTRVLGAAPVDGVVHGDVYLLGSYDPTLTAADMMDVAQALAARGVTKVDGGIAVGADPTRDGIYRALIPIEITAGDPGAAPTAVAASGGELVTITVNAKTSKAALRRPRLTYKVETSAAPSGVPRIHLTINGTLGKGATTMYPLATRERTATAVYALKAALAANGVTVSGDMKIEEFGDFVGDTVAHGSLPTELGRHDSETLAAIVTHVNKWSINWLADRVVMTAAALTHQQPPSMDLALDAMYGWLGRHPHLGKDDLLVDTGSGLSYHTQISPTELVAVVRAAAGFTKDVDPAVAQAWTGSLSIAGTDGTLRHRVRGADERVRIRGKSGTLSTVIAMSGLVDVDPAHPIAFSLVTNTKRPLAKRAVRHAHDLVMSALCAYVAKTSKPPAPAFGAIEPPAPAVAPSLPPSPTQDEEGAEHDPMLDAETSGQ